jgi:hypothetical protein
MKASLLSLLAAAAVSVATSIAASAKEEILCRHPGKHEVVITLGATRQFGRVLNCISGDFIVNLTPCAPDGAYGLSAGTGSAALVAIVDRWQDYTTHVGGVASNFTNDHEIYFSAGFNFPSSNKTINEYRAETGSPPIDGGDKAPDIQQGYKESWSFSLSRLTGEAELKQENTPAITYGCRKAKAIL